jgi:protoporphyrinogen oxidase
MAQGKVALIAGAGPAGLTAAYELLKRTDIRPIVLEGTRTLGGIAQTHNHKGNLMDVGGHRFFSRSQRVMDWWFNIMPAQGAPAADTALRKHVITYAQGGPDPERTEEVMLHRPRVSRIFHRRHFFDYPLSMNLAAVRKLGIRNTALVGASYLKARAFPRQDETFLEDFYINRFGRRLYETFFRDYTQKVWGVPPRDIRADWGAQRVKGLSLKRALVEAARDLARTEEDRARLATETSLITRFWYPKRGPGQMWETVARHVASMGGEVRKNARVVGVERQGNRVVSATVEDTQTAERTQLPCDHFFSTMPVKELFAGLREPAPPEVESVASGLQYRDFLTVGLLVKKLHVQEARAGIRTMVPDNWIYVQDGDVQVGRIQVFNNWSPYMVADWQGTVWLGLEYFLNESDRLWTQPDSDTVAQAIGELVRIRFLRREDVLDGCVLRMPKAYPAYIGTYDQLPALQQWVNGVENLFLIGRNGMHRYNNQDHSMMTAMTAVDNLVEGRRNHANLWDINLEMVYNEDK